MEFTRRPCPEPSVPATWNDDDNIEHSKSASPLTIARKASFRRSRWIGMVFTSHHVWIWWRSFIVITPYIPVWLFHRVRFHARSHAPTLLTNRENIGKIFFQQLSRLISSLKITLARTAWCRCCVGKIYMRYSAQRFYFTAISVSPPLSNCFPPRALAKTRDEELMRLIDTRNGAVRGVTDNEIRRGRYLVFA